MCKGNKESPNQQIKQWEMYMTYQQVMNKMTALVIQMVAWVDEVGESILLVGFGVATSSMVDLCDKLWEAGLGQFFDGPVGEVAGGFVEVEVG